MLDGVSLDQLRTFIAAAETGSFSAAGRRLGRAQSVVSQTLANLEGQIGVRLFDRAGRLPRLTDAGRVLLAEARSVAGGMDRFKAQARGLAGGLEPELSVAMDVMFPMCVLTSAVAAFREAFPFTPLRLSVETLGAVIEPVLDGRCAFALMGTLPLLPTDFARERLFGIRLVTVVAPNHPLATYAPPVPTSALSDHVQLVLTDRSKLSHEREFGVLSSRTWRLADLGAKHWFLRAGLGWGNMPHDQVAEDLAAARLMEITMEEWPEGQLLMPMVAAYPADRPPGPAGRWLIERVKQVAVPLAPPADNDAADAASAASPGEPRTS